MYKIKKCKMCSHMINYDIICDECNNIIDPLKRSYCINIFNHKAHDFCSKKCMNKWEKKNDQT